MQSKYESIIEAILFANGDCVSLKKLATTLNINEEDTRKIINNLCEKYISEKRGIQIIQVENSYQMCTNPEYYPFIKSTNLLVEKKALSQSNLETLAIIAYKQPITKSQIEEIRGVNSDFSVNTLIKYNLVEEKGRLNIVGKPILFGTTENFLKYFGFTSLKNLPKI